jgi:hypothetical protein
VKQVRWPRSPAGAVRAPSLSDSTELTDSVHGDPC